MGDKGGIAADIGHHRRHGVAELCQRAHQPTQFVAIAPDQGQAQVTGDKLLSCLLEMLQVCDHAVVQGQQKVQQQCKRGAAAKCCRVQIVARLVAQAREPEQRQQGDSRQQQDQADFSGKGQLPHQCGTWVKNFCNEHGNRLGTYVLSAGLWIFPRVSAN